VAKKYLVTSGKTTVVYQRGDAPTTLPTPPINAPVVQSASVVEPRVSAFPDGYTKSPPVNKNMPHVLFDKGVETNALGVKVITLDDARLPIVNATVVYRNGSFAEPSDKTGVADLTAQLMRRGAAGKSLQELSGDLETRGITIEIADQGDNTRVRIQSPADQLAYAVARAQEIVATPNLDAGEFEKLKRQRIGQLTQSLSNPSTAAAREMSFALYGDTPLGRSMMPASFQRITLDDVRAWYDKVYRGEKMVVFSGDVRPDVATKLAAAFATQSPKTERISTLPTTQPSAKRRVIVIDNPQGQQAAIRMGISVYDLTSDDKFAGAVAGEILSSGIDSRLGRYVRAEKGLTYGAYAYFRPRRMAGQFSGTVDTKLETAADAIEAMLKVYNDLKTQDVTAEELSDAQSRVAGDMLMLTQTSAQQATRRVDQVLNDYPLDYYDTYPQRIAQVTAAQVRGVMNTYVDDNRLTFVVVGPAEKLVEQLKRIGEVEVVQMPLNRK